MDRWLLKAIAIAVAMETSRNARNASPWHGACLIPGEHTPEGIMPSPTASFLGIHGTALALREQRLQLLSANVANADTPGFKAQDLDFRSALRSALQPVGPGDAIDNAVTGAQFAPASLQPSMDGNTVDGERAKAAFAQASLEYRASLSFVESKVRGMLTAITGQ